MTWKALWLVYFRVSPFYENTTPLYALTWSACVSFFVRWHVESDCFSHCLSYITTNDLTSVASRPSVNMISIKQYALGPPLLIEIRWAMIGAGISDYIHVKLWDIITHPYVNYNSVLVETPLKLEYCIPHTTTSVITYPCPNCWSSILIKWAPGCCMSYVWIL